MIYVKINNTLYPANIAGKMTNNKWDNRESKAITLKCDFSTADALFQNDSVWSIVSEETVAVLDEQGNPVLDEKGEPTYRTQQTEFDNREFCIRGDLTVHTNGSCTVEMGKPTDLEAAYELLYGGGF